TRYLSELLPEIRRAGFVYVSSDVPVVASGLSGRSDDTVFWSPVAMHSQSDYIPPDPTKFLITGSVRHNGVPMSGASIQLSGALNVSTVTNEFGDYLFEDVPSGSYSIRAVVGGYT